MKLFHHNFASRNQLKILAMKTLLFTILLFATTMNVFASEQQDSNAPESIGIEAYKKLTQGTNPQERDLSYYEIEAYLYSESRTVEVNLFNIGDAYVSIIDTNGRLIDSIDIDTDVPNSVMLNVDYGCGNYYLIISSPTIYAEGYFCL